jgi:hypothetical protein
MKNKWNNVGISISAMEHEGDEYHYVEFSAEGEKTGYSCFDT